MSPRWCVLALVPAAGCADFELPSALSRPQILAVRATPAAIGAGERARLDALIAGPEGVLAPALAWQIAAGPEGAALERDPDGATWLRAPAAGAAAPVLVVLDAEGLAAEKAVTVGGDRRDNPTLVEVSAGGGAIGEELRLPRGEVITLGAALDGPDPSTSWYATLGEIELYRRASTELVAPAAPGTGTLVVVGRDGAGGVAWRIARLVVE